MATIALNTFKTTTANVTTIEQTVYTAPAGVTTVILLAQVSNIDPANTVTVSSNYLKTSNTVGTNATSIIRNVIVPTRDSATLLTGKLILQTGDSFTCVADANNKGQLILSYLETANQ